MRQAPLQVQGTDHSSWRLQRVLQFRALGCTLLWLQESVYAQLAVTSGQVPIKTLNTTTVGVLRRISRLCYSFTVQDAVSRFHRRSDLPTTSTGNGNSSSGPPGNSKFLVLLCGSKCQLPKQVSTSQPVLAAQPTCSGFFALVFQHTLPPMARSRTIGLGPLPTKDTRKRSGSKAKHPQTPNRKYYGDWGPLLLQE